MDEELLHVVSSNYRTPRGRRVASSCRQQVYPESRPLAPLNSPQSVSPAGHQTTCPVTDLKGAQTPGQVQIRWLGGENGGSAGTKKEKGGGEGARMGGGGSGGGGGAGELPGEGGEEVMEAEES